MKKLLMDDTLSYGDNLKILRDYLPDNYVDLIYLDPPFNSKADYVDTIPIGAQYNHLYCSCVVSLAQWNARKTTED